MNRGAKQEPSSDGWWILRDGEVLAAGEVAKTIVERTRGLLGKRAYEGALLLQHTSSVHSFGMHFAIDVAFLDRNLVVLDLTELRPWRIALPRVRARSVLEAEAGAFERWGLHVGDQLELRHGE